MSDWHESISDGNEERAEALGKFESADAYFESTAASATELETLQNKNWRDDFAGDDDKFKTTLERYNTAADLGNAFREQKATISAGKFREPLAEEATEDDIKAYREANGIPMEAKGYMENLPEGLVVGEEDQEVMGDFMGVLHGMNVDPKVGHEIIKWYNGFAQSEQDAQAEMDAEQHQETEDALRTEWGADYRANINLAGAFLESNFGEEAKEQFMNGRYQDKRGFMNDPAVLQVLAGLQRKLDPVTQIHPPGGGDPVETVQEEIATINKFMREHRTEYNKDQKMQDRLGELIQMELDHKNAHRKTG